MAKSIDKGKRGEREARDFLRARGISCRRTPSTGAKDAPDLTSEPATDERPWELDELGVHVEVKLAARARLADWIEQAHDAAPDEQDPVVLWRLTGLERGHPAGRLRADVDAEFLVHLLTKSD